jgi:hypothetical protein
MFRSIHALAGVALASLAISVPAQAKGTAPPEFPFEKVWNDAPATFADFAGKVVILDFAQTW